MSWLSSLVDFVLVVAVATAEVRTKGKLYDLRSGTTLQEVPKPYTLNVKHSIVRRGDEDESRQGMQSMSREWLFEELPAILAVMVK